MANVTQVVPGYWNEAGTFGTGTLTGSLSCIATTTLMLTPGTIMSAASLTFSTTSAVIGVPNGQMASMKIGSSPIQRFVSVGAVQTNSGSPSIPLGQKA